MNSRVADRRVTRGSWQLAIEPYDQMAYGHSISCSFNFCKHLIIILQQKKIKIQTLVHIREITIRLVPEVHTCKKLMQHCCSCSHTNSN